MESDTLISLMTDFSIITGSVTYPTAAG
jgi:hypothetical protein